LSGGADPFAPIPSKLVPVDGAAAADEDEPLVFEADKCEEAEGPLMWSAGWARPLV
jgi:hypothetical protein